MNPAPQSAETIIGRAEEIFSEVERPQHFTNHQHCCECQEHDDELQPFTPRTVTREALGHMGWDPITFCTVEGFRYFLPGLIRIALTVTGEHNYYEQFLWHLNWDGAGNDRIRACTARERDIVHQSLLWLLENRSREIEEEMASDELLWAIERWSDQIGKSP